ncbi:MAG: helix-turn-helix domain-containing protein [Acidobacteriota bacterium]|nr:helix-turn-helix domain-containing protein [Acidobacteriota bacterium]
MSTNSPVLSVRDVAAELGLSVWTVRSLTKAGAIRAYRFGKVFRFDREAVNEFKRGAQVQAAAA